MKIDGKDILQEYGIFVTDNSYRDLVTYPPTKKLEQNDWAEYDGVEVDLSNIALNMRELTITFAQTGQLRIGRFMEQLSDGAYHVFEFSVLNLKLLLRLVSQPDFRFYTKQVRTFSLRFACDFPIKPDSWSFLSYYEHTGYEINGHDLSKFGVRISEGTMSEILKMPNVKKNLTIDINKNDGVIYDSEKVQYETKDVKINCLMAFSNLTLFWQQHKSLFYYLVNMSEPKLKVTAINREFPFYYKSCSTSEFAVTSNRVWWKFTLTLVFTDFRLDAENYLLVDETGNFIVTEDGLYMIDLNIIKN